MRLDDVVTERPDDHVIARRALQHATIGLSVQHATTDDASLVGEDRRLLHDEPGLQDFPYHESIGSWPFVTTALLMPVLVGAGVLRTRIGPRIRPCVAGLPERLAGRS
jgi:hypothetical protein